MKLEGDIFVYLVTVPFSEWIKEVTNNLRGDSYFIYWFYDRRSNKEYCCPTLSFPKIFVLIGVL